MFQLLLIFKRFCLFIKTPKKINNFKKKGMSQCMNECVGVCVGVGGFECYAYKCS
eukprot:m.136236 g.136236  ORF g.136236 m.136236 type:complete len:55 (-) comp10526_c0_seq1:455-619(-)